METFFLFLAFIIVLVGAIFFLTWLNKSVKRTAVQTNKANDYEKSKAKISVFTSIAIGLAIIIGILLNWKKAPPGNELFGVIIIGLGVVAILNGLYKWYCLIR
jgi:UDP-N-acetylmuramyl pentapeptide phosphotransferase/UDP-N-acetylglucosamine-1-phosphate transferase